MTTTARSMCARVGVAAVIALLVATLGADDAQARRRRRGSRPPAAAAPAAGAPVREATPGPATPAPAAAPGPVDGTRPAAAAKGGKSPKVMDFTGLDVEGKLRTPQLLYFLGRAQEELDRASLERRSFMPELSRSLDAGDF